MTYNALYSNMEGTSFLPAFLVVSSASTFIISYVTAVLRGDIDVIFPYISDTGAEPPESCIFGLLTSLTAIASLATMYARYKFIERLIDRTGGMRPCVNKAGLLFGLLSCFGMCVVATFQETVVVVVHDLGALLFFVTGVIYICIQTYISHRAHPYGSSKAMCRIRTGISLLALLALIPTVVCALLVGKTKLHWNGDEKDYGFRLASAVCEWTVAFSFVFFFLTYIRDFKLFTLTVRAELVEQD
ncbi:DNA damage-regulated autophagy modulator protein 1 [Engraulis encrasicolus]|uniref:DNA damage-regulated autophagy modulator protein 1 n=1 Tax=Engraulis encrasicolus TaxID=184585 RepID=UPI002FD2DB02